MKKIIFTIMTLFVFTSSVNAYDLTISNLQDDSASNTYTYKLNVYKATGAYQYIYNNNESYIVFDATGNTTFTLQNNEMIIIKNLPESLFQIEQIPNNKYITYTNDKKINTLSSNTKETTEITFNNKTKSASNPNTGTKETIILITVTITISFLLYLKNKKIKRYY